MYSHCFNLYLNIICFPSKNNTHMYVIYIQNNLGQNNQLWIGYRRFRNV